MHYELRFALRWPAPTAARHDFIDLYRGEGTVISIAAPCSRRGFASQTSYGAFSVSQSNAASVVKYIREQEKHHRRVTFQEEFVPFLRKSGVRYDERYIWE